MDRAWRQEESARAARNALVLRYRRAIRGYLGALLKDDADAEEVQQRVLLAILEGRFAKFDPQAGRFRDYLRRAVRNAALAWMRERGRVADVDPQVWENAADEPCAADTDPWLAAFRETILGRARTALAAHERRNPGNVYARVLRLVEDDPDASSETLAARLGAETGRPCRADAFRQQLSRARRKFAEFIWLEVRDTLKDQSPASVKEELAEMGLLPYIAEFVGGAS